ncbi:MAG: PqqD family protein [Candidatus Kapabacteria bacterium]|nr:PqqD family protein [Ignavibacteriota bacterium]MCW5883427.1 PqqD family protein [Candidatus Kapabacteria bacterium]
MKLFSKSKNTEMNYLDLTPYRKYNHSLKEDGLIDVLVPRFTDKILGKILQPKLKNPYIRANLDELGSAAWLEIDGKRKVGEIINLLDSSLGDKIQPAQQRVTLFLSYLHRNGFINFKEFNKD